MSDLHVGDRSRYPRHGLVPKDCDRHSAKVARKLIGALREEKVDHLLVTGDLTLSGEASEFERALELLAPFAREGKLTVLPGNHDVWSREAAATHRFLRAIGPDGKGMKKPYQAYPHKVDLSPEVVLIGLDSARFGEEPLESPGWLGSDQLARARDLVRDAAKEGKAAVLALHHHLMIPPERVASDAKLARMPLYDADKLVRLCAESPVAAVLHGHRHAAFRLEIPGPSRPTPVICSGSASRLHDEPARRPRALIHQLDRTGLRATDTLVASSA
ncbi:MAG: metallophosphoesterase [Deltaproteobacteria bacterium]|nr:metallophosphoesterase [Deltaproteobacteria bacterium]